MSLEPIQWKRYNLDVRTAVNDFVIPIYRYQGYVENRIFPRGTDGRNDELERRRMLSKAGETNRLILDRPYQ